MSDQNATIYVVHAFSCDCDEYYECVMAAYTTLSGAVNYIERIEGAIERPTRGSREWGRWKVYEWSGDQYPYWGPEPDDDDEDEEGEVTEPTYPFDYVFSPYEYEGYNIKRMVLDSGKFEEDV